MLDLDSSKTAHDYMENQTINPHWKGRIIGALAIAAVIFLFLTFLTRWNLSLSIRVGIAVILGTLFLIFGRRIWNIIDIIDIFS